MKSLDKIHINACANIVYLQNSILIFEWSLVVYGMRRFGGKLHDDITRKSAGFVLEMSRRRPHGVLALTPTCTRSVLIESAVSPMFVPSLYKKCLAVVPGNEGGEI